MAKTIAIQARPVFNVMDYGAHIDGTETHDHIQAAIDDCSALGGHGIVYLPAGTYHVGTDDHSFRAPDPEVPNQLNGYCLLLKSNVHLMGAGQEVTIIDADNIANFSAICSNRAVHVELSHLTITNVGSSADCTKLISSSHVKIHHVTSRNTAYSGTTVQGCYDALIEDCLSYSCTGFAGFAIQEYVYDYTNPDGYYCLNNTIRNCEAYDCSTGLSVSGGNTGRYCTNITIDNVYAHDNDRGTWPKGIRIGYTDGFTVTNCRTWNTGTGANGQNAEADHSYDGTFTNTGYKQYGGTSAYIHDCTGVTESGQHTDE